MAFDSIACTVDGRTATVTLNSPGQLNAIDEAMPSEIAAAVQLAEEDTTVHVVVVIGAGCPGEGRGHPTVRV